ncbi:hypothetical protein GE061_018940 [Apolygus lucorum]|uniref:Uncharacterized protein n=1 Tax=Apolygus lucorum TaxID=248454 RepID=A0A6A4JU35_APOLU|nr:hypothetical protein GE061_018940 [Apolygus lucorum]
MLGACLLILAALSLIGTDADVTRGYCKKVQFDFKQPQQAFSDLKTCVELDENQMDELHQRFVTTWAKYAADAGVGAAVRVLEDPELRDALLPEGAWDSLMTKPAAKRVSRSPDSARPTFVAEITLVVVLAFLTAVVAVWTLKLKSAVQKGLPTENPGAFFKDRSGYTWEPERERLLRDYEPDH